MWIVLDDGLSVRVQCLGTDCIEGDECWVTEEIIDHATCHNSRDFWINLGRVGDIAGPLLVELADGWTAGSSHPPVPPKSYTYYKLAQMTEDERVALARRYYHSDDVLMWAAITGAHYKIKTTNNQGAES